MLAGDRGWPPWCLFFGKKCSSLSFRGILLDLDKFIDSTVNVAEGVKTTALT